MSELDSYYKGELTSTTDIPSEDDNARDAAIEASNKRLAEHGGTRVELVRKRLAQAVVVKSNQ